MLALYADLPFMYLLNRLPMTCAAGRVFKGDAGDGAHVPGGLRWGGLAWRRGLPVSLASWAKRQGGPTAPDPNSG